MWSETCWQLTAEDQAGRRILGRSVFPQNNKSNNDNNIYTFLSRLEVVTSEAVAAQVM